MEVSKMTKTDFSIERILSEENVISASTSSEAQSQEEWLTCTSSSRDVLGQHAWLSCTRYQPPRIPRSTSARRRAGSHARIPFTADQSFALEAAFARAHYLAPPALTALARALSLREDRIKIWFQNRRARERREKNIRIEQPKSMALPSNIKANLRNIKYRKLVGTSASESDEDIVVDS